MKVIHRIPLAQNSLKLKVEINTDDAQAAYK